MGFCLFQIPATCPLPDLNRGDSHQKTRLDSHKMHILESQKQASVGPNEFELERHSMRPFSRGSVFGTRLRVATDEEPRESRLHTEAARFFIRVRAK